MEEKMWTNTVSVLSAEGIGWERNGMTQFFKPKSHNLFVLEVYISENLRQSL